MAYRNKNGDADLLKFKTEDDQLKEKQNETEKHDQENLLKSPKLIKKIIKRSIRA